FSTIRRPPQPTPFPYTTLFPSGAYDRIAIGDWFDYAGLVIAGPGNEAWQLDGRLDGYAVPPQGGRQLLLSRGHDLEWFEAPPPADRKSTRLNSSHQIISYAVFC